MIRFLRPAFLSFVVRAYLFVLCLTTIIWCCVVGRSAWYDSSTANIAGRILEGEYYPPLTLLAWISRSSVQSNIPVRASTLNKLAIIRLRLVEEAIVFGNTTDLDTQFDALDAALYLALSNSPSDPYLWTVLFWLSNTRNGLSHQNWRFLRFSYELGPYEGWIAAKRNRLSIALFASLPQDIETAAVAEFVNLVRSRQYEDAFAILSGPGRPIRSLLAQRLKDIPEADLRPFVKMWGDREIEAILIPGVSVPPGRPWR